MVLIYHSLPYPFLLFDNFHLNMEIVDQIVYDQMLLHVQEISGDYSSYPNASNGFYSHLAQL